MGNNNSHLPPSFLAATRSMILTKLAVDRKAALNFYSSTPSGTLKMDITSAAFFVQDEPSTLTQSN
jgi:hypothetical protein